MLCAVPVMDVEIHDRDPLGAVRRLGVARGWNDLTRHTNAPIIILMNDDVEVVPDWYEALVFSLKNVSGALFKALSVFALRDLDLSKIESRPVRGRPWEYCFYVDVLRGNDSAMRLALKHLEEIAGFVKVLGVYPRAY